MQEPDAESSALGGIVMTLLHLMLECGLAPIVARYALFVLQVLVLKVDVVGEHVVCVLCLCAMLLDHLSIITFV